MVELAAAPGAVGSGGATLSADEITAAQGIPRAFLLGILGELRRANLLASVRGSAGGWRLARSAGEVTLADVVRAVEGPLARVSEARPEEVSYPSSAGSLQLVWVALRASIREVLEQVTVADVAAGTLPEHVVALTRDPDAWESR
jgi:Rrf2 family protein